MTIYRKKPIDVPATQWFKNGDHPEDECYYIDDKSPDRFLNEGKVVRYYRTPDVDGRTKCKQCDKIMEDHGWIDTLEGGHIVCPSDWILTGIQGEHWPCKPDVFKETYEKIN